MQRYIIHIIIYFSNIPNRFNNLKAHHDSSFSNSAAN